MKNYLAEIKAFHDSVGIKQLSTGQIALWYALMYINNKCTWAEWFTIPNRLLELNTGMSRSGVAKARNQLKQLGYIDFKPQGTKATLYKINTMLKSSQDSNQNSSQNSNQDDNKNDTMLKSEQDSNQISNQIGNQNSNQISNQNSRTLNKQNINKTKTKTKTENKDILNKYNIYHNYEDKIQCDCITQSTKQRCERRSTYRINGVNYCNQHSRGILKSIIENLPKEDKKIIETEKSQFADNVFLTLEEYDKLVNTYGEDIAKKCIEKLDNYKGANDKQYKSDYKAILSWVVDEVQKRQPQKQAKPNNTDDGWAYITDEFNKFYKK